MESLTDNPARFPSLASIYLDLNGQRSQMTVEKCSPGSNGWLLKFEHVDTREQAENLKGGFVEIESQQLPDLEDNVFYIFDLIGIDVYSTAGEELGRITDVQEYPANDLYIIEGDRGRLVLPAIGDIVKEVDLKRRRMKVELLDGLEFE